METIFSMNKMFLMKNPDLFQGEKNLNTNKNYFEGWYFKNTNNIESISFIPGINIFAHIGGLIGGALSSMAVGVKYKSQKADIINGIIMLIIFILSLLYIIFKL